MTAFSLRPDSEYLALANTEGISVSNPSFRLRVFKTTKPPDTYTLDLVGDLTERQILEDMEEGCDFSGRPTDTVLALASRSSRFDPQQPFELTWRVVRRNTRTVFWSGWECENCNLTLRAEVWLEPELIQDGARIFIRIRDDEFNYTYRSTGPWSLSINPDGSLFRCFEGIDAPIDPAAPTVEITPDSTAGGTGFLIDRGGGRPVNFVVRLGADATSENALTVPGVVAGLQGPLRDLGLD